MHAFSVRSEWLKTWKRPMTLWVIGILLAVVFIRPPIIAGLSRYFVMDTAQGLRIWAGTLPEEALAIGQQMREQMTLPGAILVRPFLSVSIAPSNGPKNHSPPVTCPPSRV